MKKLHARNNKPRHKGIGKNRTRRQFPNRTCVATVSDPLNLWKCWASYLHFYGFGRRGVPNAKPRMRWWGPRQTIWKRTKTGGMIISGHRRPDHFYGKLLVDAGANGGAHDGRRRDRATGESTK